MPDLKVDHFYRANSYIVGLLKLPKKEAVHQKQIKELQRSMWAYLMSHKTPGASSNSKKIIKH